MEIFKHIELLFPVMLGLGSGFSHCLGMCGPIQLALESSSRDKSAFLSFHAGRITTYVLLGLLTGVFGFLIHGRSLPVFAMGARIFIIALFIFMAVSFWGVGWFNMDWVTSKLFPARRFGQLSAAALHKNVYVAGLVTGLLPCPATYGVLAWSLSLGSGWKSALGMFLLGISILPSFAIMWYGLQWKKLWPAPAFYKTVAVVFLGLAIWKINMLMNMGGMTHGMH